MNKFFGSLLGALVQVGIQELNRKAQKQNIDLSAVLGGQTVKRVEPTGFSQEGEAIRVEPRGLSPTGFSQEGEGLRGVSIMRTFAFPVREGVSGRLFRWLTDE